MSTLDTEKQDKRKILKFKRAIGRVLIFTGLMWNIEEVLRSIENGWPYSFFFWYLGKDYWLYWTLLGGAAFVIYMWSELDR